ncbi:MAG: hypothetical protein ACKVK8_08160, partial [Rhodospirillales bacterium]
YVAEGPGPPLGYDSLGTVIAGLVLGMASSSKNRRRVLFRFSLCRPLLSIPRIKKIYTQIFSVWLLTPATSITQVNRGAALKNVG